MNGEREDPDATKASSSRLPVTPGELFTVQAPRERPRAVTKPPSSQSSSTTIGSPLEALEHDEILRTRWFCFIGLAIGLIGAASVPLLPGDPTASVMLVTAVGVAIVAIGFLYNRTRDPIAFRKPSTSLGWFVPAAAVTTAIPYFGAFSPLPLLLVLGIYFTGLGRSIRLSLAVYAVCAGMQLLVSILVIAGARDTGIIHPSDLSKMDEIVIQLLVQSVLGATLLTARMSRRTALFAVGELERAVRMAAHREALLLEAREELERALRQGRGRFSEQTIGHYKLGTVIGKGAMGEVYEASSPIGPVAIKLLSSASLSNPNHVLRFLRELRTAAGLVSPHVVRVIEVGEHPVPFLVMEKLEGETLGEILRGRRAMGAAEVVEMVRQIGEGITVAAQAGIVHRDLKPQNIFLHHSATWKILDFGIARAIDQGDTLTAGHVVGTPSYMAPEQASGGDVDHQSDLYALAAITYRALTGQPPYAAGEIAETLYKVVHTRPRRPTDLTDLPPEIDLVLAIGMARDAEYRFTSAAELTAALAGAFKGTLPEGVFDRGRALEHEGAWASPVRRASTSRIRR